MGRWSIVDIDRSPTANVQRSREMNAGARGARRVSGAESLAETSKPRCRAHSTKIRRTEDRRTPCHDRGRIYALRESEFGAMSDIGRLRIVDAEDLARFAYQNDQGRMHQDIRSLRGQGLLEERTFLRAHRQPRRILTLTKQGHRMVQKTAGLSSDQRIYHGFVKVRDTDHDADLYKVYHQATEEIRNGGGRPLKIRLDFELQSTINREREAARRLPEAQRAKWLREVAEQHGLPIAGTTVRVPDMQVEYQTAGGRIAHANLELITERYRTEAIRVKAEAGFKVYARTGDTDRVRRALRTFGSEILSI
jgi:hypothetical protein